MTAQVAAPREQEHGVGCLPLQQEEESAFRLRSCLPPAKLRGRQ